MQPECEPSDFHGRWIDINAVNVQSQDVGNQFGIAILLCAPPGDLTP